MYAYAANLIEAGKGSFEDITRIVERLHGMEMVFRINSQRTNRPLDGRC